jgi:hypothetical protein
MTQYKATFDELPWQLPMAGFRHKIIQATPMQIRLVEYSKDMEPHWCEKGHMGYVVNGFLKNNQTGTKSAARTSFSRRASVGQTMVQTPQPRQFSALTAAKSSSM